MMQKKTSINATSALKNPKFIQPIALHYTLNDTQRIWEAVTAYDSVATLLWHEGKQSFILVKQFRAPVLHSNKTDGMMYELCAGIVDKDASLVQIAKEEIYEECGYDVPLENIQEITRFYTSVGISGTEQTMYFAVCDESMRVHDGGGLEEEDIEVIYIPLQEAKAFMFDIRYQKTSGLLMAFYWFFDTQNIS